MLESFFRKKKLSIDDHMQDTAYPLRWKKGIYPVLSDIVSAINMGTLYVAELNNNTVGAFIVNHIQGEGYHLVDWNRKGNHTEIAVLHLLATSLECQGKGIGRKMLEKAVEICRSEKDISIRLDTLPWNLPGKRLYEIFGFQYKGDIKLDYPSTGKIHFSMYEFDLQQYDEKDGSYSKSISLKSLRTEDKEG